MRIARLDLLRYGHFSDCELSLPARAPDIHIVFGPNEAGKSTALAALEDLLFGIARNSTHNFLHSYQNMRLGAVIEAGSDTFEFRRRKGNKDTLLSAQDVPVPGGDAVLAKYLHGADRAFFARMFFLDHARLREGGREILAARDDVGQALFSAGAGLRGLREMLNELDAQAANLWAPRKAAHRVYYQLEQQLKSAETALRERTVSAREWQQHKQAYEEASKDYQLREAQIAAKESELRRLNRIRRVYREVRQLCTLQAERKQLGVVMPLAENARETLDKAQREDRETAARIADLRAGLEAMVEERKTLVFDQPLLQRAGDIRQLGERRISLRAQKAELPGWRSDLRAAEQQLAQLASELGWSDSSLDTLIARMPSRATISHLRSLLNQYAQIESIFEADAKALQEAQDALAVVAERLSALPPATDVSVLRALRRATLEKGDMDSLISAQTMRRLQAESAIDHCMKLLLSGSTDVDRIIGLPVPPRASVEHHRDRLRALEQRRRDCEDQRRHAELERLRLQRARERLVDERRPVAAKELDRLRRYRDAGWSLIRRCHIEGVSLGEDELRDFGCDAGALIGTYEGAVDEADAAADRRFEQAEVSAELQLLDRQIDEQRSAFEQNQAEAVALERQTIALQREWRALWAAAPFEPQHPDTMLEWLNTHTKLMTAWDERNLAEQALCALNRDAARLRGALLDELIKVGMPLALAAETDLRVVLEAALEAAQRQETNAQRREEALQRHHAAQQDMQRKQKRLQDAEQKRSAWRVNWCEAVREIGFAAAIHPTAAAALTDILDLMREIISKAIELREQRIVRVETDIETFNRDVISLVSELAPEFRQRDADESVVALEARLRDSEQARDARVSLDARIDTLTGEIEVWEQARSDSRHAIAYLMQTAAVDTLEALNTSIIRSDHNRRLELQIRQLVETIAQQGDGFELAHLEAECRDVDFDQVALRENAVGDELAELRDQNMDARERRNAARAAFEAIGGNDAATQAAAERQAALAGMERTAEQYVRLRSAALLMRWGIERYRREKQAPMLGRAGELFAILTGNSFSRLTLVFDDQDKAHLAGVRADGAAVGVEGMSSGTADQLYFALRVAAIEDYVGRAGALPFVADDLFINFDDDRAAAGLAVLGQLAHSCQVILFTHHEHLLEIARKVLCGAICISRLSGASLVPDSMP